MPADGATFCRTKQTAAPPALAPLDSLYPDLDKLYIDLHQNPELSLHEEKTSAKMAARLKALGYEVTTGIGGRIGDHAPRARMGTKA